MKMSFNAGVIVEDHLFFSDNRCNALLDYDLCADKLNYIGNFPCENEYVNYLHKRAIRYKNKLVFIPNKGQHVHIYDVNDKQINSIEIKIDITSDYVFCDGFINEEYLWIIPGNTKQKIVKINLNNLIAEYYPNFSEFIEIDKSESSQAFWKFCISNNKVFVVVLGTCKLIVFDINNLTTEEINTGIDKLDSVYKTSRGFFLCDSNMGVYLFDIENKKVCNVQVKNREQCFGANIIVEGKEYMYLVPNRGREIAICNKGEDLAFNHCIFIDDDNLDSNCVHYENWNLWGDKAVLFPCFSGKLQMIDGYEIRGILLDEKNMDTESIEFYKRALLELSKGKVLKEGEQLSLNEFLLM